MDQITKYAVETRGMLKHHVSDVTKAFEIVAKNERFLKWAVMLSEIALLITCKKCLRNEAEIKALKKAVYGEKEAAVENDG